MIKSCNYIIKTKIKLINNSYFNKMNYINKYMKLIKNILKTKIIIRKNKQMT